MYNTHPDLGQIFEEKYAYYTRKITVKYVFMTVLNFDHSFLGLWKAIKFLTLRMFYTQVIIISFNFRQKKTEVYKNSFWIDS